MDSVKKQSGQATVEYVLLLSIVVTVFLLVSRGIAQTQLVTKLMTPITGDYAKAYQNGHYKASAPDDQGGAVKHPRVVGAPESFRIFYTEGSL
jgi:hypothetical protein